MDSLIVKIAKSGKRTVHAMPIKVDSCGDIILPETCHPSEFGFRRATEIRRRNTLHRIFFTCHEQTVGPMLECVARDEGKQFFVVALNEFQIIVGRETLAVYALCKVKRTGNCGV